MKSVWHLAFVFVILGIVIGAFVLFGWPALLFGGAWLFVEFRALFRRGTA